MNSTIITNDENLTRDLTIARQAGVLRGKNASIQVIKEMITTTESEVVIQILKLAIEEISNLTIEQVEG